MKRVMSISVAVAAAFVAVSVYAIQDDAAKSNSLKAAVEDFNAKARMDPTGKSQPPLTENEVIAAIRGWVPEYTASVSDDVYAQFQQVAESGELPEGAGLSFCSGWDGYRGYSFSVWWIDITLKTGEKSGYTFRIRDQKISSRKMTPDELAELERNANQ